MAQIPNSIAIPGQIAGTIGSVALGVPKAIGGAAVAGARMIPGVASALDATGSGLASLAGMVGPTVSKYAGLALEGAGYGGTQSFNESTAPGLSGKLQDAQTGAMTGAVAGPVVGGLASLAGRGISAAGRPSARPAMARKRLCWTPPAGR